MNNKISGTMLKIQGLQKKFGNNPVLDQVNLQIEPGEFIAVVGRSGSGKSTMLRLIAGIEKPSAGMMLQDGQPISGLNSDARMMFQEARLLPWKRVFENVALGISDKNKEKRKEQTNEILQRVGLINYKDEWPNILSGGQRQRVALARALVSRPRLLLLDEPLGALDALTRIEMQQLIEELWQEQKFTSILVTHDVEEAVVLADRVILIKDGKVGMDIQVPLPRPQAESSGLCFTGWKYPGSGYGCFTNIGEPASGQNFSI
ncbi:ATP-binding cassette domain-containing protein [Thermoactinomyces mirandus]|uniref:ATP-binding cassette domain-containing protein n=1 Tax=Thermoactinomyces mirandus TaxID=2756294 RepID=UPI001C68E6A0|nr:ATP-binding cassette domain-containing protein [Thermoactinomyces mirandus]